MLLASARQVRNVNSLGEGESKVGGMVRPKTRRARRLRRDMTEAERILWRALRAMSLPVKVRRQHPIGRHTADFAVPARRLVIEIDGGQHATTVARDAARSRMLAARGWRVIRFWNSDVMSNLPGVLETIAAEIEHSPTSPRPSPPQGGGEGGSAGSACVPPPPSRAVRPGRRDRAARVCA